jgi:uncharacterized protein
MPKIIKVVIDTNWWISFVIKKYQNQLLRVLLDERIEIYCSEELEQEVRETLKEPRLVRIIKPSVIEDFTQTFPEGLIMVQVKSKVNICRDSKDNFLLALSKDSKADYLITGDNDLLDLKDFGKTKILTMTSFLDIIDNQ